MTTNHTLALALFGLGCSSAPSSAATDGADTSATEGWTGASTTADPDATGDDGTTGSESGRDDDTTTGASSSSSESGGESSESGTSCSAPPPPAFLWLPAVDTQEVWKFDTETMAPIGAFETSGDAEAQIVTVSLGTQGRVAVGLGVYDGILLIQPDAALCTDVDDEPGVQTSTSDNALPFGTDECVTHLPSDNARSYSRVAWLPTAFDEDTCSFGPQRLWVAHYGVNEVSLLDGESGESLGEVNIDDALHVMEALAVDGGGNLWITDTNYEGRGLTRIDAETLAATHYGPWNSPPIPRFPVVDADGYVWLTDILDEIARFDPQTGELEYITDRPLGVSVVPHAGRPGLLWGGHDGVHAIARTAPYDVVESLGLNSAENLVAIDFEDRLWVAYRHSGLRRISLSDPTQIDAAASPNTSLTPVGDLTGYTLAHAGVR